MQILLFVAALSSSALADGVLALAPRHLYARQDQSFIPVSNPVSACPSYKVQCPGTFNGRGWCISPTLGDVCCPEGYGCPGGSFCLINGRCCPDGVDPKTCASQLGITLPDGFTAGNTVAYSASASATSLSQTPPSISVTSTETPTTEAASVTSSASSTVAVLTTTSTTPYVTPSIATISASVVSGTGAGSTSVVPFTGGASAVSCQHGGIVAAIIGAVGFIV